MRDEDIEAVDDVYKWLAFIALPLPHCLGRLNNDDEVVLLALVVDLGDLAVCSNHVCGVCSCGVV